MKPTRISGASARLVALAALLVAAPLHALHAQHAQAVPLARKAAQAQNAATARHVAVALDSSAPRVEPRVAGPAAVPVANRGGATVTERGTRGEMSIEREVFAYESLGRRDPFRSLMASGDLKPLLSDLRLVAVAYDEAGGQSVAILRDLATKEQYRVRAGTLLGRMRVAHIRSKSVVFTIEELGYSRQETLGLISETTAARSK